MRFGEIHQRNDDVKLEIHISMCGPVGHDPLKKSQGEPPALVRAINKGGICEQERKSSSRNMVRT
jgi:hypothetical protein